MGGALHALWCLESGFSLYSRLQIDFLVTDGYRFLRHWILLCLLVLQEHWPQLTTPEGGGSCHLGKLSAWGSWNLLPKASCKISCPHEKGCSSASTLCCWLIAGRPVRVNSLPMVIAEGHFEAWFCKSTHAKYVMPLSVHTFSGGRGKTVHLYCKNFLFFFAHSLK